MWSNIAMIWCPSHHIWGSILWFFLAGTNIGMLTFGEGACNLFSLLVSWSQSSSCPPGLLLSRALRKSLGSLFGSSSCYSFHGTQTQFSDLWHTFPASRFNNYNFKFKIVNHLIWFIHNASVCTVLGRSCTASKFGSQPGGVVKRAWPTNAMESRLISRPSWEWENTTRVEEARTADHGNSDSPIWNSC